MFTFLVKSYQICSFILDGHHRMESIYFRSTNKLNIDRYFCTVCGKKCNLQFYWFNVIDNYIVCVWGALHPCHLHSWLLSLLPVFFTPGNKRLVPRPLSSAQNVCNLDTPVLNANLNVCGNCKKSGHTSIQSECPISYSDAEVEKESSDESSGDQSDSATIVDTSQRRVVESKRSASSLQKDTSHAHG